MDEQLSALQELLTEAYSDYLANTGRRRVSDNEFARWLGVSPASFNHWINGNRTPDFESAMKLSKRLGPRIFDVLGYPEVASSNDPDLQYIVRHWRHIEPDIRREIYEHVVEVTTDREGGGG